MSRKRILHEHILFSGATTDFTTDATSVEGLDHYSYLLKFSLIPTGQFYVDGSNDNSVWSTLDFNGALLTDGVNQDFEITIREINYKYTRLRFDDSASGGNVVVSIFGKTVGA